MPAEAFSTYHFSADYQDLLIACLLRHPEELGELGEMVEARLFSGVEAFEVVTHLHDYRKQYAIYPDITTLGAHIQRKLAFQNPERAAAARVYLQKLAGRDTTHRQHVKDSIREFACHQRLLRTINEVTTAMNLGTPAHQLDLVAKVTDCLKTLQVGEDMGIHVNKDWEKVVDSAGRIRGVYTGYPMFQRIWPDGWGAGWLIAVLAPSKRFKTTFCANLAVNMAWEGSDTGDVLYYACELNQRELTERLLLKLTGMTREDLRDHKERFKSQVRAQMGSLIGNVLVKSYPSKGATIATLRAHAQQAIASFKLKPRAIIIDFAETIRPDSATGTPDYRQQADIFTQARAFGQEIGACVVMPDRANRETITAAVPRITSFQGAIEKAGIADIGIGLCQTEKEHQMNIMRYFIFINRHGPEFLHYTGRVDPLCSQMTVDHQIPYDPDEPGKETNGQPKEPKKFHRGYRPPEDLADGAAREAAQARQEAAQARAQAEAASSYRAPVPD